MRKGRRGLERKFRTSHRSLITHGQSHPTDGLGVTDPVSACLASSHQLHPQSRGLQPAVNTGDPAEPAEDVGACEATSVSPV